VKAEYNRVPICSLIIWRGCEEVIEARDEPNDDVTYDRDIPRERDPRSKGPGQDDETELRRQ
jgi:hypothetical protein